jgi:large subunit ribosomal protein L17
MRHMVDGRKFGANTSHRNAMFRTMANNLILNEQIVTTVQKAKELRRVTDRLITLAKKGSLSAKRLAFDRTRNRDSVMKLFNTLAERYSKRPGGYTRILRVDSTRWGDGAEMAMIELVDRPLVEKKKKTTKAPTAKKQESDENTKTAKSDDKRPNEKSAAASTGKVRGGSSKASGPKAGAVRKTPSKSGGSGA